MAETVTCPHCATPLSKDARFCPACGKAAAPTESGTSWPAANGGAPDLVGKTIAGRYRIVAKLGEGGMGAVYRGEQMSLKRAVAVKLLRPELSTNQMILQRFNAEAQAVAKLSHPNTVNIYDFGQDTDGSLFIAMEFIEGKSLRSALQREGPFSPARALSIAAQVAASLSDAHAHNIVHRDLKPDNVMLQDRGKHKDVVRVLDFGIAKLRDDSRATQAAMTQAGDMLGTPQYMAPEQIKGEVIDGRTDVYALGCMIYEMLTARMPFEAPTVMAMLSKHLLETPLPPSQRRPDLPLPPALDQLVMAALAKDASQRPPTMDAYAELVGGVLATVGGDPNRSAPMSIQQPVVSGQQGIATPPAMSAFQVPSPTPVGPAFTPAPPGPPPAPPMAMPMVGYQPPIQGYMPPRISPTRPVAGRPPARSHAPLFAIIGALALAAGGAGVWAVRHRKGPIKEQPGPDPWQGSGSAQPETPEEPPTDEPHKDDPWAAKDDVEVDGAAVLRPPHSKNPPSTATKPTSVGTAKTPLPKGAYIDPPDGFVATTVDSESKVFINHQRGLLLAMTPLDAGTNDPKLIAEGWSKATGAKLMKIEKISSHGTARDALAFSATLQNVPVLQLAVLYITDRYRIGVLIQAPTALFQSDPSFENEVTEMFEENVHLP